MVSLKINHQIPTRNIDRGLIVSFDNSVGHDYLEDSESRYNFYHHKEEEYHLT